MEDFFDNEMGKKLLALAKASFKVSDLISDMALREKIKHQILSVYRIFFEKKYSELLKELDVLDSFFFLAGHLNLAKEEHVKSLRNGFLVFKSQIVLANHDALKHPANWTEKNKAVENKEKSTGAKPAKLDDRQEKIMKQFQNKETLKLAEILDLFPNVSEKTVRNELNSLIGLKKITRSGKGNGSFYQMFR